MSDKKSNPLSSSSKKTAKPSSPSKISSPPKKSSDVTSAQENPEGNSTGSTSRNHAPPFAEALPIVAGDRKWLTLPSGLQAALNSKMPILGKAEWKIEPVSYDLVMSLPDLHMTAEECQRMFGISFLDYLNVPSERRMREQDSEREKGGDDQSASGDGKEMDRVRKEKRK